MQLQKGEIAPGDGAKINKVEPANKTWFFERKNGVTFACQNNEAWQIIKGGNAYHRDLKMIGCSSGEIFRKAVQESHRVFAETKDMDKARAIILKGEQDELEASKGNMELPQDPEYVTLK